MILGRGGTGQTGDAVAGVDEAGRGPLAGPVVAAAVILGPEPAIPGLADSKRLTAARREGLELAIREGAAAWAVVAAPPDEIDTWNILQATLRAMARAVAELPRPPGHVRVDGNRCPELACPCEAMIGGDGRDPAISAASILAKVARDRAMQALETEWPGYGFGQHKGYGTRAHREALQRLGPCPAHRRSFAPVRDAAARWETD